MRRIALPLGKRVFLVVATLLALLVTVPLRLALGALGLPAVGVAARAAEGSIWSGRLVEARVAGVALGDLNAGLRPLPLLIGRARLDLEGGDDAEADRGALIVSRHGFGIEAAALRLPLAGLFAPLPVRGATMSDARVAFRDGVCERAEGAVRVDMGGAFGGIALPGTFAGTLRCEAGALLVPVSAPSGERLTLRLSGTGRYRAEIALRPADPAAAAGLAAIGFVPGADGGATLALDGRW